MPGRAERLKHMLFKSESSTYGGRASSIKTFSTPNISVTKQYEHTPSVCDNISCGVWMCRFCLEQRVGTDWVVSDCVFLGV